MVAVSTFVFFLVRATGDPVSVYAPESASPATRELISERLGLAGPLHEQYFRFVGGLVTFDLGLSYRQGRPVTEFLLDHLPATLSLALVSVVLVFVIALPLGVLSALYQGRAVDLVARTFSVFGQSVPSFWLAINLVLVFSVMLGWFPVAGRSGPESYVLPAVVIAWAAIAGVVRLTRSSMLDVMQADYVRMARAKGVPERVVAVRHMLRNALIPVLTFGGLILASFMNGSVIVENVFAWPGIGKVVLDAVQCRDFPVVQGAVLLTAFFFIIINTLVDVLYGIADPRIRHA